jgi:integrase/recombinase XerD
MTRFEQFLRERRYLGNISERSVEWYEWAFKWLVNESPDDAILKDCILRMREAGLSPRSVNGFITAVNAYLKWSGSSLKMKKMKCEQKVLPTYSADDIQKFLKWKPRTHCQRRLQTIVLTLADTGTRISELLGLRWQDVNLSDLLITVRGKGNKQRTIPFSLELRKHLFRLQQEARFELVFSARDGQALRRRNISRDVKTLCDKLKIKLPERSLHAFRHSFALHYIRKSGSPFLLQRALGHTTLDMTKRYVNLNTQDLSDIHQRVSLLSR